MWKTKDPEETSQGSQSPRPRGHVPAARQQGSASGWPLRLLPQAAHAWTPGGLKPRHLCPQTPPLSPDVRPESRGHTYTLAQGPGAAPPQESAGAPLLRARCPALGTRPLPAQGHIAEQRRPDPPRHRRTLALRVPHGNVRTSTWGPLGAPRGPAPATGTEGPRGICATRSHRRSWRLWKAGVGNRVTTNL